MADGDVVQLPVRDDLPYKLGRNVNHDPQSRNFAITAPEPLPTEDFRHRRYGACVDQDGIGMCVPGTLAHILNTHPYRAHFTALKKACIKTPWLEPSYTAITAMDPYPGGWPQEDTGTDANSALKWAKSQGFITGHEWAFGAQHGLSTLREAPLMQGIDWTDRMYTPDGDGRVHYQGEPPVGGHETVVLGYEVVSKLTRDNDRVWCLNDWGTPQSSWGICFGTNCVGNYFYFTFKEWVDLIDGHNGDLARPNLFT